MKRNNFILTHPDFAIALTVTLALTLATPLPLSAQKDPEAVRVLEEFSRKAASAPSVKIDFTVDANDTREGDITTVSGSAVIVGDSYRVTTDDNVILSDGKAVWNYLPDVNEVTITEPDPEEGSFMARPSLLFSMYEKGYKVRLLGQNAKDWVIDLYPEDINVSLVRIRLNIGKTLYDLRTAEYRTKDGMTVTLTADKYDLTYRPAPGYFTFNPADYKGVEIIDMR
ncbi:MAG: outer membrane lipoprotein carrier protein LolA [Bacteroidales bacterium]|nr:outer membrane lipoprotein carrier protein LolA [Bacteroidales bacterium]